MNSSLVTYTLLSPNCTKPRQGKIQGVAIHCTAGRADSTAADIAAVFASKNRGASCNYCIGGDGSIGLVVEEVNRAWCTSSGAIDHNAISIEVASDTKGEAVRAAAVESLINLLVDICKRNNIEKLKWTGNRADAGNFDVCNMQVHRWFAAKSCPGDYLYSLHWEIANRVNERLNRKTEVETMTEERVIELIEKHGIDSVKAAISEMSKSPESDWANDAIEWAKSIGITDGSKPSAYCTREQLITIIYRFAKHIGRADE